MKKYVNTTLVASELAEDFSRRLASTIEDLQNHDCEVEVQYQLTRKKSSEFLKYTALVLAYRYE